MGYILQERYHLLRKLATGGFGSVYVAEDVRLRGRKIAVKELGDVSAASRQLFQQEARMLAALDHPGLVHVSDFFEEGRSVYLVMDYIEGQDLLELAAQAQDEHRLLSHKQVLQWMIQICEAVAYLHRHRPSIIHRDIKPNNIRLDTGGRAILVDFGIAKVGARSKTQRMAEAVSQGFSPPEQYLSGLSTDTRSDVYALGATLYCLLTASLPPDGLQRLTQQIPLSSIRKINSKVTRDVEEIISTAMATQPDQRFEDAGDLLVNLQQALELPVTSLPSKASLDEIGAAFSSSSLFSTAYQPTPIPVRCAICTECGYSVRAGARFCGKCGAPLRVGNRCPACGATNRLAARFCAHCRTSLTSARAKPPLTSPERYIQEGDRYREVEEFKEAIAAYKRALRLGAVDAKLFKNLAYCYVKQNDIQNGLKILERAHRRAPQNTDLALALFDLYIQSNNYTKALPILEMLVHQHPQKADLRVQLAICYIIVNQLQKAYSVISILQRERPENADVTFLQGLVDHKRGRWRHALRHFKTVAQQEPTHALAHYFIGEIYVHREQWERALHAYQLSAQANPKDADVLARIRLCQLALEHPTDARNALQEAQKINPNNSLEQYIQRERKNKFIH
jgi:tetratricopeptide (TPR) repeat protein